MRGCMSEAELKCPMCGAKMAPVTSKDRSKINALSGLTYSDQRVFLPTKVYSCIRCFNIQSFLTQK